MCSVENHEVVCDCRDGFMVDAENATQCAGQFLLQFI